jgi:TIGR00268 family protein
MPATATAIEKEEKLFEILRGFGRVAIGYSGGVDSSMLVVAAIKALGAANVLAVLADSPSLPRSELASALALAERLGVECLAINPGELADPDYAANPRNRCYICKKRIFSLIAKTAAERGIAAVLDGNNLDDEGDYRPGRQAAKELGIRSPLLEAGLTKAEIRAISADWGLPTADKPAMACLASRIPYGTRITAELLLQIDAAEAALKAEGFAHCRVRHHGEVARIEVPSADIARLASDEATRERIAAAIKSAGYKFAALDMLGYKMGGMN